MAGRIGPGASAVAMLAAGLGLVLLPGSPSQRVALVASAAVLWLLWLLTQASSRERAGSSHLQVAHARLEAIIDSAVDGIITIDARGRIESFNRAAERLFGYSAQEVTGRNVSMLMPPPHAGDHDTYLRRYLQTGDARVIGVGRDVDGRRRDGTTFPLHLSVGEVRSESGRLFTGILHDRTAHVALEEQLRERASLARLGEMAAVVAHEVRNPLAGIRGAIQILIGREAVAVADRAVLEEIVRRIDGLNDLMVELLLFARPPAPKPAGVQLADLVSLTADLLRQDPALAKIDIEIEGHAPPVEADAELLKIVFQNLLVNGAHAMDGRGRIRVELGAGAAAARVAFHDQGPGIPPAIRGKIFTPFFTTKSRGTGLGLPMARRLIEAHRGRITIDCPPRGGTTVLIELPRDQ